MERTVAALTRHYPRRDEASQQALAVLNQYPSLVNPEQSDFTYDDGRVELLLSLTGVLPIPIGSNTYHCPVAIWLPLDFPSRPPIVYVLPSETLQIRKGKHVDANGKVTVPYLDNWERKSEGCSLTSLVNELVPVFSARYPLSPVQPKPKPPTPAAVASSPAAGPPPRPPPPTAQNTQPIPPRPAPPPSVSPSGSMSFSSGPPPRPPLPAQSATMGPGAPARPQSTVYEQPTRSASLMTPDGRTGSPVAPPRPPPPGVDGQAGSGLPPMGRPLPGSFGAPPPPAYPAPQQPLAPPIPPPQRPGSVSYSFPPPFDPSRPPQPPPNDQLQPNSTGQPLPPGPPPGWPHLPHSQPISSASPALTQYSSAGPPQPQQPGFSVGNGQGYPGPIQMQGSYGPAAGVTAAPMTGHPDQYGQRIAPPVGSAVRVQSPTASTVSEQPTLHEPSQPPRRSFHPESDLRSSIGSTQSYRPATPPHTAASRATAHATGGRPYSPAPSETGTYVSYASSAPVPPQPYHNSPPASHRRQTSAQPHLPPQAPLHHSPPPQTPSHSISPRTQHLMYDRAQTHSPAPLSDVGSYASSRTQEYSSTGRSRGPRAPGPPSEYSATGEYGSYIPSASASTVSGPVYKAQSPPPQQQQRAPPSRSMTVSYETRHSHGAYPESDADPAFEPVIEARSPPAPPQPPQPPAQPQPPPTRQGSTRSEYTATSSAFVPQRQYTQHPDVPTYHSGYSQPLQTLQGPPPPGSVASYISSGTYGQPEHSPQGLPYGGHPSTNGLAPPIPIVAAASPPVARAARKARPALHASKPVNILDAADDDLDSNAPSSPSTVTGPNATTSVAGSDSISNIGDGRARPPQPLQTSQQQQPQQRAPPVPPNPALLALRTRLHSKLTTAMTQLAHTTEAELARLDLMRVDLEKAQPAIEDEMARLEAVRSVCAGVRDRYAQVVGEAQQRMREYEARGEGVDVDEIVCGSTVVYTQLLDLVAEDAALEDTIYALGRGLNSGGSADIDLDRFLKRVRNLAKEQFVVRATINKILTGLAVRRNARESQQLASGSGRTGTPVSLSNGVAGNQDRGSGSGGRGTPASSA
ncbi:hypothetical protein JCM10908_004270 [Rhodotorula pacifica]|uniref:uncharacterized protein n=1 Tax=Rhodotorula pacifica TaxID=1495444 RepID=UPI00316FEE86